MRNKFQADTTTAEQRSRLSRFLKKIVGIENQDFFDRDELVSHLVECRECVSDTPAASLLVEEIIDLIASDTHSASSDILRLALVQCGQLLQGSAELRDYFWLLNDLQAMRGKTPVAELVFAVPESHSAAAGDGLVSVLPANYAQSSGVAFEALFEKQLQAAIAPDAGTVELQALAELCRQCIDSVTHEYATVFWLTCSSYLGNLSHNGLRDSAAHRRVLQQIQLVIQQHVRNADSPILDSEGIALVESTLCSMLSYLACIQPLDPLFDRLERRFLMRQSMSFAESDPSAAGIDSMLGAGIAALCRKIARLKLDIDATPDSPAADTRKLVVALQEIRDVCAFLFTRYLVSELDGAMRGLSQYLAGEGALSDLERCVAVLIHVEESINVSSLDQDQSLQPGDDESGLDAHIIAEMMAMLEPLNTESADVNQEWLTVVLNDIASLSTFQSDQFLEHNLSLVKVRLSKKDVSMAVLLAFAQSLFRYLYTQNAGEPVDEARQSVTAAVSQLKVLPSRVEPPVSIAELAHDHRALLQPVDGSEQVSSLATTSGSGTHEHPAPVGQSLSSLEFGEQCNHYIDTIQLALDTALGSSGNLAPDKTVISALENLHRVVSPEHQALLQLIEPLSQVLSSAEQANSLLSQTDTLLIQEAIVAITIGVDAVANEQPMPELVADVAQRITELAVDETHKARGSFEAAGLIDIFVEEGDDIAQRLFELFQRWRAAPGGGTRIQGDVKRLLHTLKGSADTVGLDQIAQLAHALETYIGAAGSDHPEATFFEVATDAVEVVLDDIDRIRNRESLLDRTDTLLQLNGQSDAFLDNPGTVEGEVRESGRDSPPVLGNTLEVIDKTPAFGSEKYFNRLEKTQRRLSSQHWKANELQSSLRSQLGDMQASLQSTEHLLDKEKVADKRVSLSANLSEAVQDLQQLHRQFQRTLEQLEVVGEQQLTEVKELQSMVASTERLSVEHIQLRTESLVSHLSEVRQKVLRLEFVGAALTLDRKQFGDIYKPIEQLLINAVVHGVESPAERVSANKPQAAKLSVAIEVKENNVVVNISDDGAGIDLRKLREVAAQRAGFDTTTTDEVLLRSIVLQGMSTSTSVDRSAGRGVGLDIVKEWVFRKYGALSVSTAAGKGTTFTLRIPTLAESVPVMVVKQGNNFFAIDIDSIVEIKDRIESGLSLGALTGMQAESAGATINCKTSRGVFELNVDEVLGRKQVKFVNENRFLSRQNHFNGCGVINNNQVVFRLDLESLFGEQSQVVAAPVQSPAHRSSASVLIVDDSVTIRAAFGRAMQSAGYKIVLARNGLEAIEYLKANQPEVIILDLEMPLMDGYEVGSYIRNEPRLNRSALVIVSSKPRAVVGDWLTAVNADAYYEKPCSESAIAGLVADLV